MASFVFYGPMIEYMIRLSPERVPSRFEEEFDVLLNRLESDPTLIEHKDEIFAVWFASPFIKQVCNSQPIWLLNLVKNQELHSEFNIDNYIDRLKPIFKHTKETVETQKLLRQIRKAEYARIAWRDLQGYATVKQTLSELSFFAQSCLDETLSWCFDWLKIQPRIGEFECTLQNHVVIFALGKLGGYELNFSSDVDLVFAYSDISKHTREQQANAASFYLKLVQQFIKAISEQTEDGFVFRVDTRLRPFGNSGTLIPTFSAIDQYFQTHGRDWERYAWIKARVIAGDAEAGQQFLADATPFIYRRYLDYGAVQSLRAMKELVDVKARQNTTKIDIKIGQGGIREIEFIAQLFQLIYGGRHLTLRIRPTIDVLSKLEDLGMLSHESVSKLIAAYLFLRKAENGLQLRDDQQTHRLPDVEQDQFQFAFLLGADNWDDFYSQYIEHASSVNNVFQSLLQINEVDGDQSAEDIKEFVYLWQQIEDKEYCIEILEKYSKDAQSIYERLRVFSQTAVVHQLEPLARGRLDDFIPIFLRNTLDLDNSDIVIDRFLAILKKITQRSTYISLLIESQNKLNKLFKLIEISPWIAQYISTHPILLDEVLKMANYYEAPSSLEMHKQLDTYVQYTNDDLEKYMEGLREFKHAQSLQIAAADIAENISTMSVSSHLSWLAETCLSNAISRAYKDLTDKYGAPICVNGNGKFMPELLIIEYGKLGGLELGYESDLDIVFVHNSSGITCETDGEKKLNNDVFFTRLVQRAIHLMTTMTSAGKVFEIDIRLRPYGESGAIVSSINSYKRYLENEAWLWEKQALIRARPLPSDNSLANVFKRIRKNVLCQQREIEEVRNSIIEMRDKILSEHGSKVENKFNIKRDRGGLVDIEFIVQFYVLSYAYEHNELCSYTDNIQILDVCALSKLIDEETAEQLKSIYLAYRKHLHQLNLRLLPHTVEDNVFAKERSVIQKYWASLLH